MSALTDIFTALANKIRSKTGTQTTYTPAQMVSDGIDDVYDAGYAAGGGGSSATPITPSNSSPASMTAGTAYEPTVNGYAIESYSSVTPSNSTPAALADDTIYKTNGTGYAIDSYSSVSFDELNPTPIASNGMYKVSTGGVGISGYLTLTPSNASPAAISQHMYKVNSGVTGYAIQSYASTSKTPTASGTSFSAGWNQMTSAGYAITSQPTSVTPSASGTYFTSGVKNMSAAGYAYSSQPTACKTGSVTLSTSTTTSVTLGFEPKFICVWTYKDASHMNSVIYNSSLSTSKQMNGAMNGSTTSAAYNDMPYTSTGVGRINSINSTGFVIGKANTTFGTTAYYFAIG